MRALVVVCAVVAWLTWMLVPGLTGCFEPLGWPRFILAFAGYAAIYGASRAAWRLTD